VPRQKALGLLIPGCARITAYAEIDMV